MQFLGTDLLRNQLDKDLFVKNLAERHRDHDFLLIDDVRFENEARWIQSVGGHVWLITNGLPATSTHESEQLPSSLFPFDAVIYNSDDLAKLKQSLCIQVEALQLEQWTL
jgi:hypothetical protein